MRADENCNACGRIYEIVYASRSGVCDELGVCVSENMTATLCFNRSESEVGNTTATLCFNRSEREVGNICVRVR